MIPRRRIPLVLVATWLIIGVYVATKVASVAGSRGAPASPWEAIPDDLALSLLNGKAFGGREFVRLRTKEAPIPAGWSRGPNDRSIYRSVVFDDDGSARMTVGEAQAFFVGTWTFDGGELCLDLTAVAAKDADLEVDRCFDLYGFGRKIMLWSGTESRWLGELN